MPVGGGDPEITVPISPPAGTFVTLVFAGNATDGVLAVPLSEDTRPLAHQATLRIIHAAGWHDAVEVFIREPGTDINQVNPTALFAVAPSATAKLPFPPGDYEITVRDFETEAVLAGPGTITLEEFGVYGIALLNDPLDPAAVTVDYFYDFAP